MMNACKICGLSLRRDGCYTCGAKPCMDEFRKRQRRNVARRASHRALLGLGMTRVKGSLGGTYYE